MTDVVIVTQPPIQVVDVGFGGPAGGTPGPRGPEGPVGPTGPAGPAGPMYGSRVVAVGDSATITMNADISDMVTQTNTQPSGTLTINPPLGTPVNGQKLMLRIQCTNPQSLIWTSVFTGSVEVSLPLTTTGSGKYDYVGFVYNAPVSKWQMIARNFGF
jgi:hypothetical protein